MAAMKNTIDVDHTEVLLPPKEVTPEIRAALLTAYLDTLSQATGAALGELPPGDVIGALADVIGAILQDVPPGPRKDMMSPIRSRILNTARRGT